MINIQGFIKDLEGKDLKELPINKTLANIVGTSEKVNDPVKNFILATKIYSATEIELDEADLNLVKECVKKNNQMTPIVLGQLLLKLNEKVEVKPETPA